MKSKVRILHLIASNFVGGPEKQILHHALKATSPALEIWIGSFRKGPARSELLRRAEEMALPTLELRSSRFNPHVISELAQELRRKEISILCTHGYKANLVGWAATHLTNCKRIGFVRGWTAETWRVKLYERLDRLILRHTNWIVCVSRPLAEQLGKGRRRLPPPIVIPNAVLLGTEPMVLPPDRVPIRRALGLREDAFLVCTAGRLSVEKGQRYLIDAAQGLVSQNPKLQILVLGEGRERKRLEDQVVRLRMQNHVIFTGFKDNVGSWIQACDVLANPSLTEGVPNVILEAMALGTPVVATAVGGVPDLIQHGESGLLVPPRDRSALASAIFDLYANPQEGLRFARNAYRRVFREYSSARQAQRLFDLYDSVLRPAKDSLGTKLELGSPASTES